MALALNNLKRVDMPLNKETNQTKFAPDATRKWQKFNELKRKHSQENVGQVKANFSSAAASYKINKYDRHLCLLKRWWKFIYIGVFVVE